MLARGVQVHGIGCWAQPVFRKVRFLGNGATDGALTLVAGECDLGYTVTASSSGLVITVTGPKVRKASFISGKGLVQASAAASAMHHLVPNAWSPTTGTYTFAPCDESSAAEILVTGDTYEIVFLIDEGSS